MLLIICNLFWCPLVVTDTFPLDCTHANLTDYSLKSQFPAAVVDANSLLA